MHKSKMKWVTRSRMGRLMCRLLGERRGAVAMEYVVIALLVAAAVVGLVMAFGDSIAGMFQAVVKTTGSDADIAEAGNIRQQQQQKASSSADTARSNADKIRGGDGAGGGGGGGED